MNGGWFRLGLRGFFLLVGFELEVDSPFGEFRGGHRGAELGHGHVEDFGEGEEVPPLAGC